MNPTANAAIHRTCANIYARQEGAHPSGKALDEKFEAWLEASQYFSSEFTLVAYKS